MTWVDLSAPDQERLERLNALWRLAGDPPVGAPLSRRLVWRIRRLIARLLGPQETFNAAVVEHINATSGGLQLALVRVASSVDEVTRYRESLAARERRIEATMATIAAAQHELRTSLGVLQQATHSIKREVARLASVPMTSAPEPPVAAGQAALSSAGSDLESYKYVGFEDQFRGSAADIRQRVAEYLPIFRGASDVLDVGCGRGEFLLLLREHGITARGIDLNGAMVEACREKGLDAHNVDALAYLRAQPDESLGGMFAAQVIEHLEPTYLTKLLDAAFAKLRPGSPIVLETINPGCWFAFFESYIRDLTHVRPVHPDTLKYLLMATGFQQVEILYRAPYPESEKLQAVPAMPPAAASANAALAESIDTLNANVEKINRLLFTYLDYAAIGRRP
jgi:2-polyprenyl-3-methyl-5-hydroxy-6-metoxy-1,4-benzoquinol methylase